MTPPVVDPGVAAAVAGWVPVVPVADQRVFDAVLSLARGWVLGVGCWPG